MTKRVLVIGSGGREHALLWKLAQSPLVGKLYIAPGNGGTHGLAEHVPLEATETVKLSLFAEREKIDLTVVGPEDPLIRGIVIEFRRRGLFIFGPGKVPARFESSKSFAAKFMRDEGIPAARSRFFSDYALAYEYLREERTPIVIKASGRTGGSGVYFCDTREEAEEALEELMIYRVHGDAGSGVIIEEYLKGDDVSLHAITDGRDSILFPPSELYTSVHDGDRGKKTEGMGAVAPLLWISPGNLSEIGEMVVRKAFLGMKLREIAFTGCLYPRLLLTEEGVRVLEYNVRFGDPETQVYMRLMKSDLYELLEAAVEGRLAGVSLEWHHECAVSITIASGGYPDKYRLGIPVFGITRASEVPDVVIFHGGTSLRDRLRTSGGRVLHVTATANTLREAVANAYEAVSHIRFQGMHLRTDIGKRTLLKGSRF